MHKASKVSIIVPVYNDELYIGKCIDSLVSQTYNDLEIIIVDDGSFDGCPDICDNYSSKDSRIKVIHKNNEGASFARRTGLEIATGEYILFVDGDDWIDESTVAVCLTTLLQNESDCVIFGYVREYPNKSIQNKLFDRNFSYDLIQSEEHIHRRIIGPSKVQLREPYRLDNLSSCCMRLMKSSVARKGLFVSDKLVGTSEDTIYNLYALENCKISYINRYFYHYRKYNVNSITTQYKHDLVQKWDVMYQIMKEYCDNSAYKIQYNELLLNRVACGMIGLGLNELQSSDNINGKAKKIRSILNKPLYRTAILQLDISYCDLKWKIFFVSCKVKASLFLVFLLKAMNYLKSRTKG